MKQIEDLFVGGEPNQVCKLNIINLNKQAKLFGQGMQPVIRIGENGRWERMRDNTKYSVSNFITDTIQSTLCIS